MQYIFNYFMQCVITTKYFTKYAIFDLFSSSSTGHCCKTVYTEHVTMYKYVIINK